jgi:hypothetical protein
VAERKPALIKWLQIHCPQRKEIYEKKRYGLDDYGRALHEWHVEAAWAYVQPLWHHKERYKLVSYMLGIGFSPYAIAVLSQGRLRGRLSQEKMVGLMESWASGKPLHSWDKAWQCKGKTRGYPSHGAYCQEKLTVTAPAFLQELHGTAASEGRPGKCHLDDALQFFESPSFGSFTPLPTGGPSAKDTITRGKYTADDVEFFKHMGDYLGAMTDANPTPC